MTNYVKALHYLQGIERNGKSPFTIRERMKTVNEPKNVMVGSGSPVMNVSH